MVPFSPKTAIASEETRFPDHPSINKKLLVRSGEEALDISPVSEQSRGYGTAVRPYVMF
jgi:hypothetical protein